MNEAKYQQTHIGLLERVEMYAKNIQDNVGKMKANQEELGATLKNLVKGPEKGKGAGGDGGGATRIDSKSLGDIGMNVKTFAKGVLAALPALRKMRPHMEMMATTIANFVVNLSNKLGDASAMERADKAVSVISTLSGGIYKFVTDAAKAGRYMKFSLNFTDFVARRLGSFVKAIAEAVAGHDVNKAKTAAEIINMLGGGIVKFLAMVALSAPLLVLAIPGLLLMRVAVGIFGWIAGSLASNSKNIEKAGAVVRHMGIAMLIFTAAIIVSALAMSQFTGSNAVSLLILFGVMAISALAFALIGRFNDNINKGVLSVLYMAGVMVIFAIAMLVATKLMPDFGTLAMLALGVMVVGIVFWLAGMVQSEIIKGAIAFIVIGLALIVMGIGVKILGKTISKNPHLLWQIPVLLVGLGAAFAIAGALLPLIALGSLAVGMMGGALWLVGKGVQAIMKPLKGASYGEINKIETVLRAVINGFGRGFQDLSITQALTLPLKIPMVAFMGMALGALGRGLGHYRRRAGDWKDRDTEILGRTIQGIARAFALSGSEEGMTKIFGFPVGRNNTERGIDSTMRMGKNLSRLAKGIAAWKRMNLTNKDIQTITDNILRVLNTIPGAFATIGMREKKSKGSVSFLGITFSNPFEDGDVEAGIKSTRRLGGVLKSLAGGIAAWKKMSLTTEEVQLITDNITRVLNTIPGVFAAIGKREKNDRGKVSLLGIEFTNPLEDGDIEAGIKSVRHLGGTLKSLAQGVRAWKDNKKLFIDKKGIQKIRNNIIAVLDVIPHVFADIGRLDKEGRGIFGYGEGDVEAGIRVISPLGRTLKNLAMGVKAFQTGGKYGFKPEQLNRIRHNINEIVFSVPRAFGALGAGENMKGEKLRFDKDDVYDGVWLVNRTIKPLRKLAKTYKMFKAVDIEKISENVGKAIFNVVDWVGKAMSTMKPAYIYNFAKLAHPLTKLALVLPKINNELTVHFKFLSKMDKRQIEAFDKWANAMKTLSTVNVAGLERTGLMSRQLTAINSGMDVTTTQTVPESSSPDFFNIEKKKTKKEIEEEKKAKSTMSATELRLLEMIEDMGKVFKQLADAQSAQQMTLNQIKNHLMNGTLKTSEVTN